MPKNDAQGRATAYGSEGIIRNAEGGLSELDPSRNLDGTAVDGYESDERDLSGADERELPTHADPEARPNAETREAMDEDADRVSAAPLTRDKQFNEDTEEKSSPGSSSPTSRASRATNATKK
jgi:hypothetical protein